MQVLDSPPALSREEILTARRQFFAFREGIQGRRAIATAILVAVMIGIFGVELWLGATDRNWIMNRMGALLIDRTREGEVWRAITGPLLHANFLHVAMNLFVLWRLGADVERILGSTRFIVLYVVSALSGSLASVLFSEGSSVGASGAIWGIMTAQAALAYRAKGILPDFLQAQMRRAVVPNLALNVMISFAPGISMSGHFGGGIAGAILIGSGLLTLGLPRWANVEPGESPAPDQVPLVVKTAGFVASVMMIVGVVYVVAGSANALFMGQPSLSETPVGTSGCTMGVPWGTAPGTIGEQGESIFGDIALNPVVLYAKVLNNQQVLSPEAVSGRVQAILDARAVVRPGTTLLGPPTSEVLTNGTLVLATVQFENGLALDGATLVSPERSVEIEVVRSEGEHEWWDTVAQKAAASVKCEVPGVR